MNQVGYSGKPIWQKLGIRPETGLRLIDAPADYAGLLDCPFPLNVVKSGESDMTHCFATSKQELAGIFPALAKNVADGGCIWISWYKKSSGISTDLTEDIIRNIVLPAGWVDIKVCA